jgi:putative ABC transport system substrate-binding protein
MKKLIALVLAIVMCMSICATFTGCEGEGAGAAGGADFTVGVCQLMRHDSLDQATKGFVDALTEALAAEGKTVTVDTQIPDDMSLCGTVVNTFVAQKVDLIMGNATPALLAAANATTTIPVLGTSVTDYADTFAGNIPANVTGTSDAVPFAEQAQMMIDTLKLVAGDKVGVLYCANESNSKLQYEAVKALFEEKGIVVGEYKFSEVGELQSLVGTMAAECKAIYIPSDNTVAQNDSIVGTICNEQKIPVFTSYGGTICYASLAIDYYELGVQTGKMAAQILLGQKQPSELEIATLTPAVVYNKELCADLGIEVPAN